MSHTIRLRMLQVRSIAERAAHVLSVADSGKTVEIDDPQLLQAVLARAEAQEGPRILVERELDGEVIAGEKVLVLGAKVFSRSDFTPKQLAFLQSMKGESQDPTMWVEVFDSERRTVQSLAVRGILEVHRDSDGKVRESRLAPTHNR